MRGHLTGRLAHPYDRHKVTKKFVERLSWIDDVRGPRRRCIDARKRLAASSKMRKAPRVSRGFSYVVELSGNCPPSPNRRTNTFSRLSFEFVLSRPAPRNRATGGSSS